MHLQVWYPMEDDRPYGTFRRHVKVHSCNDGSVTPAVRPHLKELQPDSVIGYGQVECPQVQWARHAASCITSYCTGDCLWCVSVLGIHAGTSLA